jgi:hypothetical protein
LASQEGICSMALVCIPPTKIKKVFNFLPNLFQCLHYLYFPYLTEIFPGVYYVDRKMMKFIKNSEKAKTFMSRPADVGFQ